MKNERLAFIVNPNAGSGKGKGFGQLLQDEAANRGLNARFYFTHGPGEAIKLSEEASRSADVVIAVGGDGTVNEVMNGIWNRPVRFGVIPCGTGNDFIKMLGMDKSSPVNALDQLIRMDERHVDIGLVQTAEASRYFINSIGIGFDALVAARANQLKYLGIFSYLLSVITTLITYREPLITLETQDANLQIKLFLMTFGNGTHAGGVFNLTPGAKLDDGWFHTTIISDVRKQRVFDIFPKVLKGTHLSEPEIKTLLTRTGKILSPENLTIHADGEIISRNAREVEVGILEKQMRVLFGG